MSAEEQDAPWALLPNLPPLACGCDIQPWLLHGRPAERATAQEMDAAVAHLLLWCSSTTVYLSWGSRWENDIRKALTAMGRT